MPLLSSLVNRIRLIIPENKPVAVNQGPPVKNGFRFMSE
jgi:hypothetical protein